jgi:hypothetical protein
VLGPRNIERKDPRVQSLQVGQFGGGDLVVRHDEEVHVAVDVGVADRERALQVCPAEVVREGSPHPRDQLLEDTIELGVAGGFHRCAIVGATVVVYGSHAWLSG